MLASRLVSECVTLVFVSEFKLAHLIKKKLRVGQGNMAKNSYHGIYFEICHNDIIDDITDARQSTLKLHNFIGAKKTPKQLLV